MANNMTNNMKFYYFYLVYTNGKQSDNSALFESEKECKKAARQYCKDMAKDWGGSWTFSIHETYFEKDWSL